jgi:hypothetical protein
VQAYSAKKEMIPSVCPCNVLLCAADMFRRVKALSQVVGIKDTNDCLHQRNKLRSPGVVSGMKRDGQRNACLQYLLLLRLPQCLVTLKLPAGFD